MNEAYGALKSELSCSTSDRERILWMADRATEHRIDVHLEFRVLREPLQFPVKDLKALLRDLVRHYVVNTDSNWICSGHDRIKKGREYRCSIPMVQNLK